MRKIVAFLVVLLFAVALWDSVDFAPHHVYWDGDDIEGPVGVLVALAMAGGGLLVAALTIGAMALVAGLVVAGTGLLVLLAMLAVALLAGVLLSPLLLFILVPVGLYWAMRSRERRQAAATSAQA